MWVVGGEEERGIQNGWRDKMKTELAILQRVIISTPLLFTLTWKTEAALL